MSTAKKQEVKRRIPPITIQGATLKYKNFGGAAKRFNAKGLRNFHVVLDEEFAELLKRDGWNVKYKEPKEEGDSPIISIKVSVRFDNYPPRIWLVTERGKTLLDEDSVSLLDDAEIKNVDLVLNASTGTMDDGKPYVKAYLAKMFVTLDENDLELKYAKGSHSIADED